MLRQLNWSGIAFGAGAGLVVGLAATAILGGVNGGTLVQVLAQFLAFFVAGYVAGRFSLVGAVYAGGFAGLFLYFGLAVVSVATGNRCPTGCNPLLRDHSAGLRIGRGSHRKRQARIATHLGCRRRRAPGLECRSPSTLWMRAGETIAATSVVEESPDSTGHDAG